MLITSVSQLNTRRAKTCSQHSIFNLQVLDKHQPISRTPWCLLWRSNSGLEAEHKAGLGASDRVWAGIGLKMVQEPPGSAAPWICRHLSSWPCSPRCWVQSFPSHPSNSVPIISLDINNCPLCPFLPGQFWKVLQILQVLKDRLVQCQTLLCSLYLTQI